MDMQDAPDQSRSLFQLTMPNFIASGPLVICMNRMVPPMLVLFALDQVVMLRTMLLAIIRRLLTRKDSKICILYELPILPKDPFRGPNSSNTSSPKFHETKLFFPEVSFPHFGHSNSLQIKSSPKKKKKKKIPPKKKKKKKKKK